jgi:predicted ATPase
VRNLPPHMGDFTGRIEEVRDLLRAMSSTSSEPTAVLVHTVDGMAGVGKTALVVHVAHLLSDRYSDMIYLDLRAHKPGLTPFNPEEALEKLLDIIGVPSAQIPPSLEGRIGRWRSELANRRALLILDNAASADQVQHLLPGTPGSAALITSRTRLVNLHGATPLTLRPLLHRDAVNLFRRIVGEEQLAPQSENTAAVVERCGYLLLPGYVTIPPEP